MRVAILAARGHGTTFAEETEIRFKPLVKIGGRPILHHIIRTYSHREFNNFVIVLECKNEMLKKFMVGYRSLCGNIKVNLKNGECKFHEGDGLHG